MAAVGHKMTHAESNIPPLVCLNPKPSTISPLSPDHMNLLDKCVHQMKPVICILWRTTCIALPNINKYRKLMFSQFSEWKGIWGWFGAVFFGVASLSWMSSVTVCDKMADSICDTLDHKYTTPQPRLIHHLDQEESHLCPLSLIGQHWKLFSHICFIGRRENQKVVLVPDLPETFSYCWVKSEIQIRYWTFWGLRILPYMFSKWVSHKILQIGNVPIANSLG